MASSSLFALSPSSVNSRSTPFDEALDRFRKTLSPEQASNFRLSTAEGVKQELLVLEKQQEQKRLLRGLRRVETYVRGMLQFSEVIGIFAQINPELLGFIWVRTKLDQQLAFQSSCADMHLSVKGPTRLLLQVIF